MYISYDNILSCIVSLYVNNDFFLKYKLIGSSDSNFKVKDDNREKISVCIEGDHLSVGEAVGEDITTITIPEPYRKYCYNKEFLHLPSTHCRYPIKERLVQNMEYKQVDGYIVIPIYVDKNNCDLHVHRYDKYNSISAFTFIYTLDKIVCTVQIPDTVVPRCIIGINNDNFIPYEYSINENIPKFIFRTSYKHSDMKGLLHLQEIDKKNNPDYSCIYFDEDAVHSFIIDHIGQRAIELYDILVPGAYKADLFRLYLIYTLGGVYADIKMVILHSLSDKEYKIKKNDIVFVTFNDFFNVNNCYNAFLCSKPCTRIFEKLIDKIEDNISKRVIVHYENDTIKNKTIQVLNLMSITGPDMIKLELLKDDINFITDNRYVVNNEKIYIAGKLSVFNISRYIMNNNHQIHTANKNILVDAYNMEYRRNYNKLFNNKYHMHNYLIRNIYKDVINKDKISKFYDFILGGR